MRNLLLVKTSENPEEAIDVSSENLKLLKEESEMIDVETLMRYIRIFSELSNQIRLCHTEESSGRDCTDQALSDLPWKPIWTQYLDRSPGTGAEDRRKDQCSRWCVRSQGEAADDSRAGADRQSSSESSTGGSTEDCCQLER